MDMLLWLPSVGWAWWLPDKLCQEKGVPRRGGETREEKMQYPRSLLAGFCRDIERQEACPWRLAQMACPMEASGRRRMALVLVAPS